MSVAVLCVPQWQGSGVADARRLSTARTPRPRSYPMDVR